MGFYLSFRRRIENMPRLTRIADYCVPTLLSGYIFWGSYVTTFEIGGGWLRQERGNIIAIVYLATTTPLLLFLSYLYYKLITLPADHSTPPNQPPTTFTRKEVPFETTNESGDLAVCQKPGCNGRWKPPRAHHCSTCGVCRVGFDHHCPWIGTCVTTANRPAFMLFLLLTSITLPIALFPVRSILLQHAKNAYEASWEDPWIRKNWWDWKGSWIVFGGPGGRYVGATFLGYSALKRKWSTYPDDRDHQFLGAIIREPRLLAAIGAAVAVVLSVFCSALFIINLRNVCRGLTTIETYGAPRPQSASPQLIWIPSDFESFSTQEAGGASRGMAVARLPKERPYDLGWRNNTRALLWGFKMGMDGKPYYAPRLSPEMLRRMREVIDLGKVPLSPTLREPRETERLLRT